MRLLAALLAALLLLAGCSKGGSPSAGAKPTATVTVTETADPAEEPTPEEDPTPVATVTPKPRLFQIGTKIREKECFGSAGCNITYQIDPQYVGPITDLDGSWDITYKVIGGEDGPVINTFQIDDRQASFDQEEYLSTHSKSTKLKVVATSVSSQ